MLHISSVLWTLAFLHHPCIIHPPLLNCKHSSKPPNRLIQTYACGPIHASNLVDCVQFPLSSMLGILLPIVCIHAASMRMQMLGISLLLFRTSPKSTAAKLMRAAGQTLSLSGSGTAGEASQQGWLGANLPIILMYSPVHLFFTLGVLSFSFMPLKVAVALWVAYLLPYYLYTHIGNPAHTGNTAGQP